MKRFKEVITILEISIILSFSVYTFFTNNELPSRFFYWYLEISVVSFVHLYNKFHNKFE